MTGKCPNCDNEIIKEVNKNLVVLGSYRSIKFNLEDGSYLTIPMCMVCYEKWDDKTTKVFMQTKAQKYLEDCYSTLKPEKKKALVDAYLRKKITGIFRKNGPASGRKALVWR